MKYEKCCTCKNSFTTRGGRVYCKESLADKDDCGEYEMSIKALEQEPKYCDRNICIKNEYNGIGCDECEVTKSQEPSVEILKTERSNDNNTKYLNINVSDGEVKRNPDIVRLCSDVGVLEYVKSKTGHWIKSRDSYGNNHFTCPFCEHDIATKYAGIWKDNYCSNCGAKMVKPQESEGSE